ncbi:MAG: deoxyuridine 5'-triphosphate nucleotidohydrolase [Eubacteriales bacterium]|nr:deoxyuridine 5'-triphosphate nucleotidohydrolase [Eubacteriales bacterium]
MERIAKFSPVTEARWIKDWCGAFEGTELGAEGLRVQAETLYRELKIPKRATAGSAGYDFYTPVDVCLKPGESIKIPTGMRVEMSDGWVLLIVPRSSLGFKYKLELNNTVGVIDSDYYYSDNEGHIFIKIINSNPEGKTVEIKAGQAFAQGIFVMYGITEDDDCASLRNGGFGSTDVVR